MSSDLLQSFEILTKFCIQIVWCHLWILSIFDILLSVQKPIWNFVLTRITNDRNQFLNLKLQQNHLLFLQTDSFHTSSSVNSPALLFKSTSAFLQTILANRRPIPCKWLFVNQFITMNDQLTLIAVNANITFLLPSMFVFITRRMCWNLSGITYDLWVDA